MDEKRYKGNYKKLNKKFSTFVMKKSRNSIK